jgi:hypothetical protein
MILDYVMDEDGYDEDGRNQHQTNINHLYVGFVES